MKYAAVVLMGILLGVGTVFSSDFEGATESLVERCVNSSEFGTYIHKNKKPVVIVDSFENRTGEHINTSSLTKEFETAFKTSKKVRVVANALTRDTIRQERKQQQIWASEETAKRLANETGADLMLVGSIESGDSPGRYRVYAELIDIESTETIWMDNTEITLSISKPAHSTSKSYSPSPAETTCPAPRRPSPAWQPDFSGFLDYQEKSAMAGIFIGGGDLLQAREMDRQHSLSFGFLLPAFWLGDWGNIFYWGGKVGLDGNIAGSHTIDYSLLAGATLRLWRLQPYIEGGVGLSHGSWNPVLEATPGIDLSLGKQSPMALGVFYKFRWHSDWEHITGREQYLGARILIRPMNFRSIEWPDLPESDGNHVISLGYIFPTNLTTAATTGFSAGSKDDFGISVSWEDADNKLYPGIIALSYRRSQVQEEGGSHQTGITASGTERNQDSEPSSLINHSLMLEGSLGWQLVSGLVFYGGAGIGLSLIPENNMAEEGEGHFVKEFDWQVQGGVRVKLFNLLYTRPQLAYLHNGEVNLSLHLGLALF